MTFALEIVEGAAAQIFVGEEGKALESSEFALMTRILNDYCASLFMRGIDFGYRPVSSASDPLTSPDAVNEALKFNLAVRSNGVFGLPLDPDVRQLARETEKALKAGFMRRPRARMPTIVPAGTGNQTSIRSTNTFYPFSLPEGFLRLDTSSTVTITTINTPVQVGGWTIDRDINVTALESGSIEYVSEGPFLALLEANFTIDTAASDQFTFYFAKNGAILEQSSIVFDADKNQNIFMRFSETLRRRDVVSILVENNSDVTDLVLTNGHFRLT